jgi:hypothetical protein
VSSTIHGTGKKRRDDVYNRVTDLLLKGQCIPLSGFFDGSMGRIVGASSKDFINLQSTHPQTGLNLIICGVSKCGGPDVCG